jgi:hypothetical protein
MQICQQHSIRFLQMFHDVTGVKRTGEETLMESCTSATTPTPFPLWPVPAIQPTPDMLLHATYPNTQNLPYQPHPCTGVDPCHSTPGSCPDTCVTISKLGQKVTLQGPDKPRHMDQSIDDIKKYNNAILSEHLEVSYWSVTYKIWECSREDCCSYQSPMKLSPKLL